MTPKLILIFGTIRTANLIFPMPAQPTSINHSPLPNVVTRFKFPPVSSSHYTSANPLCPTITTNKSLLSALVLPTFSKTESISPLIGAKPPSHPKSSSPTTMATRFRSSPASFGFPLSLNLVKFITNERSSHE